MKMPKILFVLALVSLTGLAQAAPLFTLTSPAFADDALLPLEFAGGAACGAGSKGGDTSPPLRWANAPSGTKSFAIVVFDPDGRRGLGTVHWVAYGIPADSTGVAQGAGSAGRTGLTEGKTSRGLAFYNGPCGPPTDSPHHYVIDVLALDLAPDALAPGLDRDGLLKAIAGHSLGPASLVVRYRRQE